MTATLRLYLAALDRTTAVVDAVPAARWDTPTPCPDWSARQLLGHLIDGQQQVLAMVTGEQRRAPVTMPRALGSMAGTDPAAAWRPIAEGVKQRLGDVNSGTLVSTPLGSQTIEQLLGIALIEPVIHGWDLAVATGQHATLDPDAVSALLPGVLALGDHLSASGMYRPPVDVSDDAPAGDRLLAALGRAPRQP